MPPGPYHMLNLFSFTGEIIFSAVIIIFCLIIFLKTKEAFQLTRHKGIGYFRHAFLFLGASYLFRLILRLIYVFDTPPHHEFRMFMQIGFFVISYLSTVAITYLFLSSSWKKIHLKFHQVIIHSSAILISVVAAFFREPIIFILVQGGLLIFTLLNILLRKRKTKKTFELAIIYVLLVFFWIISLSPLNVHRFVPIELVYTTQILSLVIFTIITYKISKWIRW